MHKYLHETSPGIFYLDHRLTPEVRAMLAAMASRAPVGGIKARYQQLVDAVAHDLRRLWLDARTENTAPEESFDVLSWYAQAEDRLCVTPLHPKVQGFFDQFVGMYGHSSIMELTGTPTVYTEGISWYTAWLLFDSPLCAGQEFSTRAVQHKDWPMARECSLSERDAYLLRHGEEAGRTYEDYKADKAVPPGLSGAEWIQKDFRKGWATILQSTPHPDLAELHQGWFKIFEAEVAWWKDHLSVEANRLALGIGDKEPFRPALDRARWALPGTISTGCCHTGHIRERARVLRDGALLAQRSKSCVEVWDAIRAGYAKAVPGFASMGLREAVYNDESRLPQNYTVMAAEPGDEVEVEFIRTRDYVGPFTGTRKPGSRSYLDAVYNHVGQVRVSFRCSLAVARDWHRHRTMYPWSLDLVMNPGIRIHRAYSPMSDYAKAHTQEMLDLTTKTYLAFSRAGNQMQAMLCLPLGAEVLMVGQGGLRDVIYMLELRRDAHGANFEYKAQATQAMKLLSEKLHKIGIFIGSPIEHNLAELVGL